MKKLKIITISFTVLGFFYLAYNYYYSHKIGPAINDKTVADAANSLRAVTWPNGTELVEVKTYVGGAPAVPSFQNVQLYVWGLVKSKMSCQELELFLADQNIVDKLFTDYNVFTLKGFSELHPIDFFDSLIEAANYNDYYVIYSFSLSMEQRDYRMKSSDGWPQSVENG